MRTAQLIARGTHTTRRSRRRPPRLELPDATIAERCVPDFPQAAMESNLHIGMSDPTVLRIDVPTQVQIVA
jgi:hypothetical protein